MNNSEAKASVEKILKNGAVLPVGKRKLTQRKVITLLSAGLIASSLLMPTFVSESKNAIGKIWSPVTAQIQQEQTNISVLPTVNSQKPLKIELPVGGIGINPFDLTQKFKASGYTPPEALLGLKLVELLGSPLLFSNDDYLQNVKSYQAHLFSQLSSSIDSPEKTVLFANQLPDLIRQQYDVFKNQHKIPEGVDFLQFQEDLGFSAQTNNAAYVFTLAESLSDKSHSNAIEDFSVQNFTWKDVEEHLNDSIARLRVSNNKNDTKKSTIMPYQRLKREVERHQFYYVRLSPWLLKNNEEVQTTYNAFLSIAQDMSQQLQRPEASLGLNGRMALNVLSNSFEGAEGMTYQYHGDGKIRVTANLSAIPHEHFHALSMSLKGKQSASQWKEQLSESFKNISIDQAQEIRQEQKNRWQTILTQKGASSDTLEDLSKRLDSIDDWDERISLLRLETGMSREEASIMVSLGEVLSENLNPNQRVDVSTMALRKKVDSICQQYCSATSKSWTHYSVDQEEGLAAMYASQFKSINSVHSLGSMDEMLMMPGIVEASVYQAKWVNALNEMSGAPKFKNTKGESRNQMKQPVGTAESLTKLKVL